MVRVVGVGGWRVGGYGVATWLVRAILTVAVVVVDVLQGQPCSCGRAQVSTV